ncbi:uncharacterized protein Dwil_GK27530 [Drosophila willistoni]|uniref:BTB domain-containing protein n=1 Tax=Drosophila willistoni TaxID=7260 RepID=A0A0Q9WUA6_DROWI|nr:BTB/POZ domain-containing protein 9 [Drosophila willistoni]KRF99758.1 uncharacterized protein Dwil_GK27530 [Drosophila willistoni]
MANKSDKDLEAKSMGKVDLTGRLLADMASLCLSESYADVEFLVEEQKLPAHRVVLAVRSEYFRALLYGGMSESTQRQIQLDVRLDLFKLLLEYIYTGNLLLTTMKEDVVFDMLGTADQYGFHDLQLAISKYLTQSLTLKNVCVVLDAARLNNLEDLTEACLSFMDDNASDLLQEKSLSLLSRESLEVVLHRDSFYATEEEIFQGVLKWSRCNPTLVTETLWDVVRLPLMGIQNLVEVVRPLEILGANKILDAIAEIFTKKLPHRSRLVLDKNVASAKYFAQCTKGNNGCFLLDTTVNTIYGTSCYTSHTMSENNDCGIVVELGAMYKINHIRLMLWDKGIQEYSYFIEVSVDDINWERVVDYSQHHCRSWQYLYFDARPVRFIRIVGTHNAADSEFYVVSLKAMHTSCVPRLIDQFVSPVDNVATIPMHACVMKDGNLRSSNLLNGNFKDYDSHMFGTEGIVVRLRQPFHVGSICLLLFGGPERRYSFYIETSTNYKDWEMVVDKRNDEASSWQDLHFTPRPVVYIRIVGTAGYFIQRVEDFCCLHMECPSQAGLK